MNTPSAAPLIPEEFADFEDIFNNFGADYEILKLSVAHYLQSISIGFDRLVEILLVVRGGDKTAFKLRRRQINSALQHLVEIPGEKL